MIHDVAKADQVHAEARETFERITQRVKELRAKGLSDEKVVARLVQEVGAPLVGKLNGRNDTAFWEGLWSLIAGLAYGAVTEVGANDE
jgi:hypothetical protein